MVFLALWGLQGDFLGKADQLMVGSCCVLSISSPVSGKLPFSVEFELCLMLA